MRMLAFHFLAAALPESRSNSVGLTTCPRSVWTALRCTMKVPRMPLHTTWTVAGAFAAFCTMSQHESAPPALMIHSLVLRSSPMDQTIQQRAVTDTGFSFHKNTLIAPKDNRRDVANIRYASIAQPMQSRSLLVMDEELERDLPRHELLQTLGCSAPLLLALWVAGPVAEQPVQKLGGSPLAAVPT